jgi:hypothetical protein
MGREMLGEVGIDRLGPGGRGMRGELLERGVEMTTLESGRRRW